MVIVQGRRLGVSRFFTELVGQPVEQELGLVLPARIHFERWLGGQPLEADVFVDPGADATLMSHRWIAARWSEARPADRFRRPLMSPRGFIRETVSLNIAGRVLDLPPSPQLSWQRTGGAPQPDLREMPGYEDLLLGRDFLRHHGLLLVLDGGTSFSLVLPDDEDNIRRQNDVRRALE
jgi:hypothetical protein